MATLAVEPIDGARWRDLRAGFRGALLRPGEEGYDEARRVWNGAIDRRPALIARCAGADDVVTAVRFARKHEMTTSVRGGGHSVAGHGVCDGGLMIDLSLMKATRVDPHARTVRAAGGVLWGELDRACQQVGLATTGGIVSHTGIAGLTLGGGLGHLMRSHGLAVDNLLGVDLVTADGDASRVDARTEPGLFWGLRGAGANFGIATVLEYRLHPVGPILLAGPIFWPLDQAPAVLRLVDDYAPVAPDQLGITLALLHAPPAPFIPPDQVGRKVIGLILVWSGDPAAGAEAVAPLRAIGSPIVDALRPMPYLAVQTMLDAGAPHGRHYYWKAHRIAALSPAVVDVLLARAESMTSPFSQIAGWAVGGAVSRIQADATAVAHREIGFELNLTNAWQPTDLDRERHVAWVRDGWEALAPHASGVYANFISDEGAVGVRAAYPDRLGRLTALKDRYDPTNFFRLNANIRPTAGDGTREASSSRSTTFRG